MHKNEISRYDIWHTLICGTPDQRQLFYSRGMNLMCEWLYFLIQLTAVFSTEIGKKGWFAFGCFKHSYRHKYACEEDRVNYRTNAEHQD